jgi:hypothetical protein
MEGGGVVVPNQSPDQGFFHMPKLQVLFLTEYIIKQRQKKNVQIML